MGGSTATSITRETKGSASGDGLSQTVSGAALWACRSATLPGANDALHRIVCIASDLPGDAVSPLVLEFQGQSLQLTASPYINL